jgi:hypothetical protein
MSQRTVTKYLPDQFLDRYQKLDQLLKISAQTFDDIANGLVELKDARKINKLIGQQIDIVAGRRKSVYSLANGKKDAKG